jgi:anthranilate phosphoribosyltransferase
MGVFAADLTDLMAHVLRNLGTRTAVVVNGYGGIDELTVTGPSRISYLKEDGTIETFELDPVAIGFEGASISQLRGGEPEENAAILRGILDGSIDGAKRDVVLLNSGAALWAAGMAKGIESGIQLARQSLDSGAALKKLDDLIAYSQSFAS